MYDFPEYLEIKISDGFFRKYWSNRRKSLFPAFLADFGCSLAISDWDKTINPVGEGFVDACLCIERLYYYIVSDMSGLIDNSSEILLMAESAKPNPSPRESLIW